MARPGLARRALAEGIATFALVFAGCGAIVVDAERGGALGALGIAAVFGLVVLAMVHATGHLSGAHLNPAVTAALVATRHVPARDAAAYVPAQLAGAVLAALALRLAWGGAPADLGATVPSVGAGPALVYELLLTALLLFTVAAVATDGRAAGAAAGLAIGAAVGLASAFGGPVTGASLNPARSFGPALVAGRWDDFWIYLVGPLAGALLGALAYQLVRGTPRAHAPVEI